MAKVKNVRPGIVIIADAGLKLGPGEVADVNRLTSQAEKAITDGLLARIDTDVKPKAKAQTKPAGNTADEKSTAASNGEASKTGDGAKNGDG